MPDKPDHVDRIQAQWSVERPEIDTAPMGIIARLHRIADALRVELIDCYRDYDLGEGEFDILATLRRSGPPFELTPSELAQQTMVTTGAVSKRLDRLEAAGRITRRGNQDDGRGRLVALTETGRETIDEAYAAHLKNEERLLAHFSAAQREHLQRLLRFWSQSIESGSAEAPSPSSEVPPQTKRPPRTRGGLSRR